MDNSYNIADPDVRMLTVIATSLYSDYEDGDMSWAGSPFAWIKSRPSRQIGKIGEQLVAGFFAAKNFDVAKSPDSEADRIIGGVRVEIKFSTLWKAGSYKFQQLRDQNYHIGIWLGIAPFNAHCWIVPKSIMMEKWRSGEIRSQHGGRAGRDTAWLTVDPNDVPQWLRSHGGTLSQAVRILRYFSP